jgi:hypothetical protein
LAPLLLFFLFFFVFSPSLLSTNADPSIDRGLRGGVEHEKIGGEKPTDKDSFTQETTGAPHDPLTRFTTNSWMELG